MDGLVAVVRLIASTCHVAVSLSRSLGGRDTGRCAANRCQADTSPLGRHHNSDNGERVIVFDCVLFSCRKYLLQQAGAGTTVVRLGRTHQGRVLTKPMNLLRHFAQGRGEEQAEFLIEHALAFRE
jgi:hypothetical protein